MITAPRAPSCGSRDLRKRARLQSLPQIVHFQGNPTPRKRRKQVRTSLSLSLFNPLLRLNDHATDDVFDLAFVSPKHPKTPKTVFLTFSKHSTCAVLFPKPLQKLAAALNYLIGEFHWTAGLLVFPTLQKLELNQ